MWYFNGHFEIITGLHTIIWTKFIINTWFVEEYILQSFEKLKTITFHKILEKRDVLIKSIYEVYVWSLWRVCVKFLKSWLRRYSEAHYHIQSASSTVWFIYRFGLTYNHYFQHVCMLFILYQHARLVGWRPN